MAKQISFLKFTGKLGDVVGYKFNNKYFVRKQADFSEIDRANSPNYKRARKINSEFSMTVKDSKLFRITFRDIIEKIDSHNFHGNLNGKFITMLIKDTVNEMGKRRAFHSDFEEIHHMEIGEKNKFSNAFIGDIDFNMDEDEGVYKISFKNVHFSKYLYTSKVTNSCRLMVSLAKIDFEKEDFSVDMAFSEFLPIKNQENSTFHHEDEFANFELELKLNPKVEGKLFAILGIEYSSLINGYRDFTYGHCGMIKSRF